MSEFCCIVGGCSGTTGVTGVTGVAVDTGVDVKGTGCLRGLRGVVGTDLLGVEESLEGTLASNRFTYKKKDKCHKI